MISIRRAIADVVNERRDRSAYGCVDENYIRTVEVRRGCAEVEVKFKDYDEPDDPDYDTTETIGLEDVLTALLQQAIDQEKEG